MVQDYQRVQDQETILQVRLQTRSSLIWGSTWMHALSLSSCKGLGLKKDAQGLFDWWFKTALHWNTFTAIVSQVNAFQFQVQTFAVKYVRRVQKLWIEATFVVCWWNRGDTSNHCYPLLAPNVNSSTPHILSLKACPALIEQASLPWLLHFPSYYWQ